MRTTKSVPIQIKKLRGTYRNDRDGRSISLIMPTLDRIPPSPTEFTQNQIELWNTICQTLLSIGLLQEIGLIQIMVYCDQWEIYKECRYHIEKNGTMLTTGDGRTYKNPSLGIMKRMAQNMIKIADQFGFSPLSRSKLMDFNKPSRKGPETTKQVL